MIIETSVKPEEDLDLLCNTLNAEAGRFLQSDPHHYRVLIRAQAAIQTLVELLDNANDFSEELKGMLI